MTNFVKLQGRAMNLGSTRCVNFEQGYFSKLGAQLTDIRDEELRNKPSGGMPISTRPERTIPETNYAVEVMEDGGNLSLRLLNPENRNTGLMGQLNLGDGYVKLDSQEPELMRRLYGHTDWRYEEGTRDLEVEIEVGKKNLF